MHTCYKDASLLFHRTVQEAVSLSVCIHAFWQIGRVLHRVGVMSFSFSQHCFHILDLSVELQCFLHFLSFFNSCLLWIFSFGTKHFQIKIGIPNFEE